MIWGLLLISRDFLRSSRHLGTSFPKNHPVFRYTWPKNAFSHCQRACLETPSDRHRQFHAKMFGESLSCTFFSAGKIFGDIFRPKGPPHHTYGISTRVFLAKSTFWLIFGVLPAVSSIFGVMTIQKHHGNLRVTRIQNPSSLRKNIQI